jgi:hypothetical protein
MQRFSSLKSTPKSTLKFKDLLGIGERKRYWAVFSWFKRSRSQMMFHISPSPPTATPPQSNQGPRVDAWRAAQQEALAQQQTA